MIYRITNKVNGKTYIGMTAKSLEERFQKHCYNSKKGMTYLYKAMRKYGIDNFEIEFLCEGMDDEESEMISKYNPEYNLTGGGTGGDTSNSPNYISGMKKRRSYVGKGNPNYGKRDGDSPNAKKVIVDGVEYPTITLARKGSKRSFKYIKENGIFL